MPQFWFGRNSLKRLKTTHEIIQEIFMEAIKFSPIDFGVPEYGGKRQAEEQNMLCLSDPPRSKCDGYIKLSYHQSGKALDIFAFVNGKASWDERYMRILAGHILATAKRLGYELRWGGDFDGDWNFDEGDSWDAGHFELVEN